MSAHTGWEITQAEYIVLGLSCGLYAQEMSKDSFLGACTDVQRDKVYELDHVCSKVVHGPFSITRRVYLAFVGSGDYLAHCISKWHDRHNRGYIAMLHWKLKRAYSETILDPRRRLWWVGIG